ncbi:MAG TPA: sulfate ABC transporter substrate-binding protein [Gemmataceae bacterium]|jgi:sulfate transport system substrate-binding protein
MRTTFILTILGLSVNALAWIGLAFDSAADRGAVQLLNVSYDPTRELWRDLNVAFKSAYESNTGRRVTIRQSHGGSGAQARAVIDGLAGDVVTLALWSDTDAVRATGLIADGWEDRLPHRSLPYYSTIVFVVRRGNPKAIRDWPDLVRNGVRVITPNPKTSGNGKLAFLAAWGAVAARGGSEAAAEDYVARLYRQVPVLDTGARGATTTFAQNGIGDVHLTWENEAHLEVGESGGALEIVYPSVSIRAEPYVAVVDRVVDRKRTRPTAEAYLRFLYTAQAQEIIARNRLRPVDESVAAKYRELLPAVELFPVAAVARDWRDAQRRFFADGGVFDRIYQPMGR